jgi:hypothetical protein
MLVFTGAGEASTDGLPIRNSLRLGRALSHAILHIFPQLQGLLHSKNAPPCSGALTILTLQMFTRDTSLPNYWGNSILQWIFWSCTLSWVKSFLRPPCFMRSLTLIGNTRGSVFKYLVNVFGFARRDWAFWVRVMRLPFYVVSTWSLLRDCAI